MMPTVNRSACGMSVAMKSTPESRRFSRNAAFRANRSSLAISKVAPSLRQRAMAFCHFLPLVALAAFDFGKLGDQIPVSAVKVFGHSLALRVHAKAVDALFGG